MPQKSITSTPSGSLRNLMAQSRVSFHSHTLDDVAHMHTDRPETYCHSCCDHSLQPAVKQFEAMEHQDT